MEKIRLIPEYEEVSKLYLSFENEFFNTRFKYGKAIADIVNAVAGNIPIDIFVKSGDKEILVKEFKDNNTSTSNVKFIDKYSITMVINLIIDKSSGTSITTSGFPIFAESKDNTKRFGLTYNYLRNHEKYDKSFQEIEEFGKWIVAKESLSEINLDFDFNSAAVAVMDDIVLISDDIINKDREEEIKSTLKNLIVQNVYFIPSLPGDYTNDLDTYLFPVKNKVWIVSKYPNNSLQERSISKTISLLQELGHTIHFVPGLENIKYNDINTMPNYTNCIMINDLVLVPEYKRDEDRKIKDILENYGFKVKGIDSRKIVESNSVLHCISRTLPKREANE